MPYVRGDVGDSFGVVSGLNTSVSTGSGTMTMFSCGTPAAANTSALNLPLTARGVHIVRTLAAALDHVHVVCGVVDNERRQQTFAV